MAPAAFHGLADILHCFLGHVGIAGAVGYEEAVVVDLIEVVVPWHEHHFHAAAGQTAYDVVLDSAVDEHHRLVAVAMYLNLFGADFSDKILFIGIVEIHIAATFDNYLAEHGALLAEMAGKGAGVDSVYSGDMLLLEPVAERPHGLPVRVVIAVVLSHNGAGMDMVAFKKFADLLLLPFGRNAIVAEDGVCGNENLSFIGRVGEAFRIAGHGGVEHHLSRSRGLVAE